MREGNGCGVVGPLILSHTHVLLNTRVLLYRHIVDGKIRASHGPCIYKGLYIYVCIGHGLPWATRRDQFHIDELKLFWTLLDRTLSYLLTSNSTNVYFEKRIGTRDMIFLGFMLASLIFISNHQWILKDETLQSRSEATEGVWERIPQVQGLESAAAKTQRVWGTQPSKV